MQASPAILSLIGASFLVVGAALVAAEPKAPTPASTPAPLLAEITADLKSLHAAFEKYLVAHDGIWPQQPDINGEDEPKILKWWTDQLRPFGAKDTDWYVNEQGAKNEEYWGGKQPTIGYISSGFDAEPLTPYRWKGQPWLVSRFWAPSAITLLPDGTVKVMPTIEEMIEKAKARGVDTSKGFVADPDDAGLVPLSKIPEPLRPIAKNKWWKVTGTGACSPK